MQEKICSIYVVHIQTCRFQYQNCSMAKVVPDTQPFVRRRNRPDAVAVLFTPPLQRIQRYLQIPPAVLLRLGQPPAADIDLQRMRSFPFGVMRRVCKHRSAALVHARQGL